VRKRADSFTKDSAGQAPIQAFDYAPEPPQGDNHAQPVRVASHCHSQSNLPHLGVVSILRAMSAWLGAILIVVIAGLLIWWRSGWAMTSSARKGLQEILWLSCLLWGFLLMISAATEGFPYTSIHIRGDLAQDIVGALGFLLAMFGVYYGFALGQTKKW
jgi:hypothetical protein